MNSTDKHQRSCHCADCTKEMLRNQRERGIHNPIESLCDECGHHKEFHKGTMYAELFQEHCCPCEAYQKWIN